MSMPVSAQAQARQGTAPPQGYTLKQEAGESRYEVKPEERINVSGLLHVVVVCQHTFVVSEQAHRGADLVYECSFVFRYMVRHADVQFATSAAPAFLRLGTAAFVGDGVENFKRPTKMLELYEFQGEQHLVHTYLHDGCRCMYCTGQGLAHWSSAMACFTTLQDAHSVARSGRPSHCWIWTS